MLDLNDFRNFVRIVECGGFTAAGRKLGVPKSTVSHRLQRLETSLGVRLINRTSRSLSMTDAGELLYQHAVEILERADLAESVVRQRLVEPSGTIRFTASMATSLFILRQILPSFIKRYPKISIVQHISNDQIDIVGENFDLAVRSHSGPLLESTLVQRTLTPAPWFLFAAPEYLDRRGLPLAPEQLTGQDTLTMQRPSGSPVWKLKHPTFGKLDVPIKPRLASNDIMMLKQGAQDGIGIAALPGYVCRDDVEAGRLKRVLPEWLAGEATITAVIPFRRGVLPSVRVFVDFLAEEIPRLFG